MAWIAIIILICICTVLIYKLSNKIEVDRALQEKNQQLKEAYEYWEKSCQDLKYQNSNLNYEYQQLTQKKEDTFKELNQLENNLNKLTSQNEKIATDAYNKYVEILESKYNQVENDFDVRVARLKTDCNKVQEDLDKLKTTRAAAHEALLKEQEVKDNKDNYRLLPSQADLTDARRLEIVKRELNKPRILSMLIWQTYWQPLAKKQFPVILQDKTKMGIYKVTNTITDECYIGQSVDVYKRWCDHCKCGLGIDTPPGNKLYKAIQEYGLENFTFELLTECTQLELDEKEKYFISLYQADVYGYNGNKGVTK